MLGVTADQLCTIYRTQFAVLYGYDHNSYVYDAKAASYPTKSSPCGGRRATRLAAPSGPQQTRPGGPTSTSFRSRLLDREADMRTAYAEFERRLAAL